MRLILLLVLLPICAACTATPPSPPDKPLAVQPASDPQAGRKAEAISGMTEVCYNRIQNTVGETRPHRGVIWAECMTDLVMPLEQRLRPERKEEISFSYRQLVHDMEAVYEGRTTLARTNARWARAQRQAGKKTILAFRDTFDKAHPSDLFYGARPLH